MVLSCALFSFPFHRHIRNCQNNNGCRCDLKMLFTKVKYFVLLEICFFFKFSGYCCINYVQPINCILLNQTGKKWFGNFFFNFNLSEQEIITEYNLTIILSMTYLLFHCWLLSITIVLTFRRWTYRVSQPLCGSTYNFFSSDYFGN